MWVPSLLVISGRTQVKGAKATSTDSPPKGYGTPNLVVLLVAGWSQVSGSRRGSQVSGPCIAVNVSKVLVSLPSITGATHRGQPAEWPGRLRGWKCQPIL